MGFTVVIFPDMMEIGCGDEGRQSEMQRREMRLARKRLQVADDLVTIGRHRGTTKQPSRGPIYGPSLLW